MGSEHGGPGLCDTRLLIRGESGPLSSSAYNHQSAAYHHYKPAGASLCGGAEGMNEMGTQSLHSSISGGRAPFTSGQWAELEHQALIFKYMMAGVNVPQDLLIPIRRSVADLISGMTASHHAANLRWGPIHRGVPSNADPEPGRCRRTDGKKWRCSRDVVPDQKYCERHMHRGRHRPRRHADGQAGATGGPPGPGSATSSSGGAAAVSGITNVGPIRSSGSAPTSASSFSLSSLRPSNLSVKSFSSSHSGSPGSGGGSSPAASSQFGQLPNLTSSPSGASNLSNKDYRYLGSMIKSEQGIGSEQQILSSETSGSTGGGPGQESQMMSNLSRLPSLNWQHSMSTKIRPAPEPKVNSNLLHYHSPQMRGLLGQDFGLLPETSQVDVSGMQSASQQQQQAYVNNAYGGGAESVSVGRESEGQPLRHFFDDWPRSRDQSAMTWGSGVDDSERSNSDNLTHAPNNTQLSISIPITAPSSAALSAQHSSSPPAGCR
ncbi:hypothetical protein BDL97_01G126100 [Sphagnum fallax]|nr:hypothetical protein BDL97_01G126100 [Sphagnum fallax]